MRLNAPQLRAVNRVILGLYEDVAGPEPLEPLVDLIESLLPVPWISVDEVNLTTGAVTHRTGRRLDRLPELQENLSRFLHENPIVAYAMQGKFAPALRISDFTSLREIKQTGFYQTMARHFSNWRDQAAVPVRLEGKSLGFALNRDKKFSDEEILMFELLQRHIERVLRRATRYLSLPTESPLTAREREVLHWLSEGKRDSEIAVILGISVRTVEQHVRVCLRKLGVENRAGAMAAIWRTRCSVPRSV